MPDARALSSAPPAPGMLMPRSSDERLARLAGGGNTHAFAALYERYHQQLYRFCLSIVRTPEDAHDALQSTFERAFAALRRRDREIAVRPWLFRIAHNESVSILRRRRPEDSAAELDLPAAQTLEQTAAERARLAELVADLQALPLRQRSALLMRELSGLSLAEIAAAMTMSTGAVKQALFEARTSLQAYAEGRAMTCESVRRAISDGDRRALRARNIRAHLRSCEGCAGFESMIASREADLRVLAPALPAAAAASMLTGLLSHGAAHAGAGAAASGSTLAAAKGAASSLVFKGAAGIALTAAVGAGAVQLASQPSGTHHRAAAHARAGARVDQAAGEVRGSASAGGAKGSASSARRSSALTRAHGKRGASQAAHAPASSAVAGTNPGVSGVHGAVGARRRAHGSPATSPRPSTTRAHGSPPHKPSPGVPATHKPAPSHPQGEPASAPAVRPVHESHKE